MEEKKEKLKVVTTIFPEYDITKAIAKDKVDIEMLIKPGIDVHSFSPTPQDIKTVEKADMFIYGGTDHDKWVETLVKSVNLSSKKVVKLTDNIQQLEEETVEGMKHEHNHSHDEKEHEHDDKNHSEDLGGEIELDPHFWTTPKNAILMTKSITNALIEKDEDNAAFYKENAEKYIKGLEEIDLKLHEVVKNSKLKKVVIADRFPFRYLFDELGLEYRALFSGCTVESTASAGQIKEMENYVIENKIPVVYHIEMGKGDLAKIIGKDTGAKVMELHSIHTVTDDEFKNGTTYIDLMNRNIEALKEGLN